MRLAIWGGMRLVLLLALLGCEGSYISDSPDDPGGGTGGDDDTGGGDPGSGGSGGGGSGGGAGPQADFAIELDTTSATLVLGEVKQVTVTVRSINDFAGSVTLATAGLPESWDVTFTPSDTVAVSASGTATATAVVTIPTDAEATTASVEVTGSGAPGDRMAALSVEVRPELVLRIPQNALNNPETSFGGTVTVRYVAPGTRITWINDDTVAHRIHAGDGDSGLGHQGDDMAPGGGSYEVTITQPGTFDYNCHIHPQMAGRLVVSAAP